MLGSHVKELVAFLARSLVEHPDRVSVDEVDVEDGVSIELRVDPDDLGMVIGRKGRTAAALRAIVAAAAARKGLRVTLEILD